MARSSKGTPWNCVGGPPRSLVDAILQNGCDRSSFRVSVQQEQAIERPLQARESSRATVIGKLGDISTLELPQTNQFSSRMRHATLARLASKIRAERVDMRPAATSPSKGAAHQSVTSRAVAP